MVFKSSSLSSYWNLQAKERNGRDLFAYVRVYANKCSRVHVSVGVVCDTLHLFSVSLFVAAIKSSDRSNSRRGMT